MVVNIWPDTISTHPISIRILWPKRKALQLDDFPEPPQSTEKIIFLAIGWITNFYVPDSVRLGQAFRVDTEGATRFQNTEEDPDINRRPVIDIIRELGSVLPILIHTTIRKDYFIAIIPPYSVPHSPDVLNVASMNICHSYEVRLDGE